MINIRISSVESTNSDLGQIISTLLFTNNHISRVKSQIDWRIISRDGIGSLLNRSRNDLLNLEAELRKIERFINDATQRYKSMEEHLVTKGERINTDEYFNGDEMRDISSLTFGNRRSSAIDIWNWGINGYSPNTNNNNIHNIKEKHYLKRNIETYEAQIEILKSQKASLIEEIVKLIEWEPITSFFERVTEGLGGQNPYAEYLKVQDQIWELEREIRKVIDFEPSIANISGWKNNFDRSIVTFYQGVQEEIDDFTRPIDKFIEDEQFRLNVLNREIEKPLSKVRDAMQVTTIGRELWGNLEFYHYEQRDQLNGSHPSYQEVTSKGSEWILLDEDMSVLHDNHQGKPEEKYINPDGREAVFDGDTLEPIADPSIKGTYNYINPALQPEGFPKDKQEILDWVEWISSNAGHAITDVIPYYLVGQKNEKNQ
ncbi:hypothetical protein [Cytobacillus sp. IB215316]|uniref:hypothetical protein n=1 Tax=Cytobacillus sp. IB215316 TaxID=3097354 RepID=UPI002A0B8841|nr:hypothetical protein [Cytobacillus sp. IB215316]MDX8360782.1 hypothetical protein [Cytobacillus sp. IB215316]